MTRPRVMIVDNYDSFVGVLFQYLGELGARPRLTRNDALDAGTVRDWGATHLLISPGPKTPAHAGASVELIREFAGVLPILGVCLGHQAIGAAFGGRVGPARVLVHGKSSPVHHDGRGVLAGLPSPFPAGRYHSLALDRCSLPEALEVTAWTEDGEIMGVRHRDHPDGRLAGVQFHPESVLTEHGHRLLSNFLAAGD